MPFNLTLENVPDEMVKRLRKWAERHDRSLEGELVAILEAAVGAARPLSPMRSLPRSGNSASPRRAGLPR
jgi:antitoxin FitA